MNEDAEVRRDASRRVGPLILCLAFLVGAMGTRCAGENQSEQVTAGALGQSVMDSLSQQGIKRPKIIAYRDLTKPFATRSRWELLVVEEETPQPSELMEDRGPIFVCLTRTLKPHCGEKFYRHFDGDSEATETPFHLLDDRVVYAGRARATPLLLIQVCGAQGPNGNCLIATALYRYESSSDDFVQVFLNVTARNNNQETRFIERGPLEGDVIADEPTGNAPFTYWVEVYRPQPTGRYVRILRYRGHTGYGDGNSLAVIDSEMPEILRRLGFWRDGDALPVPPHLPSRCRQLVMNHGEEWCR